LVFQLSILYYKGSNDLSTKNFIPVTIARPLKALALSLIDMRNASNAHACFEKTSRTLHKPVIIFEYNSRCHTAQNVSIYYNKDIPVITDILCLQIVLLLCRLPLDITASSITIPELISLTYLHTQRRLSYDKKRQKIIDCLEFLNTILCSVNIPNIYSSKAPERLLTISIKEDIVGYAFPLAPQYATRTQSLQYALFPLHILHLCNEKRNTIGFLLTVILFFHGKASVTIKQMCLFLFGIKMNAPLHIEQKRRIQTYLQKALDFFNEQNTLQCTQLTKGTWGKMLDTTFSITSPCAKHAD
jgi:hypothetical protein